MAEQEELRLTVTVDDRATAQLQGLRGQLASMGTGAQAAGMERMRRQSVEVGQGVGSLSEAMRAMATRAGVVGGVVGAVAGKLVDLGIQFVQRATDVKAYSEALLTLHRNAQFAGTSAAQFQANMDLMRESSGVGAEQAAAGLQKFGEVWVDLQRQNSQARRTLTQGLAGQDLRNMQNLLTSMAQTDTTSAMNLYLDYADRIEQFWIDQGQAARGAQVRREFLARGGLEGVESGRRFAPVSPEDVARENARKEAAKAYREDSEAIATAYDRMVKSAAAILMSSQGTGGATGIIKDNMLAAATAAETLEDNLRKAQAAADKAAPQPGTTGKPGDEWWQQFNPLNPANIAREKAAREAAGLPPLQPPTTPPPRQVDQEQRLREFNERERQRREQEERDRGPPPAPTGPTRPSAPVVRPPGAAPIRIPPAPQPLAAAPPAEPPVEPAAPAAPAAPAPDLAEQQRREAEAERRRQAARLRGGQPQPAPPPPPPPPTGPPPVEAVPQMFFGGQVSTAMPLRRFTPDPNFLAGRERDLGTAGGAIEDRRALDEQATQTRALTDELQRLNTTLRERGGTADQAQPPTLREPVSGETLGLDAIGTQPQPIIVPPSPPPQPIIVPFAERFGDWSQAQPARATPGPERGSELAPQQDDRAPPPSAFEGSRIGMMGGAAMDQSQVAQALDAKALDRAAARDVNVNGTGKISVDVRAPAGTRVNAQGQGLFKRTEITRQTQMMPAEYGPTAATGIGAAEG